MPIACGSAHVPAPLQVAVLLFLQRFNVPLPLEEYAKGKWKATMADGKYEESAVASLTVIIPWYRHCQMERTSRWTVSPEGKWYNGKADGEFVDVPTLQTFASLLSGRPAEGSSPSARRILFLDLHEYLDIENG